jgi:hypothetical protein
MEAIVRIYHAKYARNGLMVFIQSLNDELQTLKRYLLLQAPIPISISIPLPLVELDPISIPSILDIYIEY